MRDLNFEINAHTMTLYNGHKSFYASITIGKVTWWVMRWDIARTTGHRFLSRDGLMGWTWGRRVLRPAGERA